MSMSLPDIDESDVEAVAVVMRSGRLALGPQAEELGRGVAAYVGVDHGVAVSSGTAALHLAVRALGLGPGDEVVVPSFTFAASVTSLLYERVRPVFADIDAETYCLDPAAVEAVISERTRALMVVDVFGHPAPWRELEEIARHHRLAIIDDACEALGAEYGGRRVGGFGDAACFAFYPNKQMTTGEGGVLVTDDTELAAQVRSLRNHGRGEMGAWLEHERLGFNYRMDEMSAALGVSQLRRLENFLAARARVAELYFQRLGHCGWLRLPVVRPGVRMSWFVFVVTLDPGLDRDQVIRSLAERGIPARAYFLPLHDQPFVRRWVPPPGALPMTEQVARRTLALPFHNHLTAAEVDRVATGLEEAVLHVGVAAAT